MGAVLKRTLKEFKEDNLTDWAAALTYYGCWRSPPPCWP
jgi:membrane protein